MALILPTGCVLSVSATSSLRRSIYPAGGSRSQALSRYATIPSLALSSASAQRALPLTPQHPVMAWPKRRYWLAVIRAVRAWWARLFLNSRWPRERLPQRLKATPWWAAVHRNLVTLSILSILRGFTRCPMVKSARSGSTGPAWHMGIGRIQKQQRKPLSPAMGSVGSAPMILMHRTTMLAMIAGYAPAIWAFCTRGSCILPGVSKISSFCAAITSTHRISRALSRRKWKQCAKGAWRPLP